MSFEALVIAALRDGLVVEDIAVKHECTPARVRRVVRDLRKRGELAEIYGGAN